PLDLYDGASPEHRTLFSTVLIDFSELLSRVDANLAEVERQFNIMQGSSLSGDADARALDHKIDLEIAQSLGFACVTNQSFALNELNQSKALLAGAYRDVADACEALIGTVS